MPTADDIALAKKIDSVAEETFSHYSEAEFQEAEAGFRRLIQLTNLYLAHNDYDAEKWVLRGSAFHYLNEYYEAIYCYDRALHLVKGYRDALFYKALSLRNLGEYYHALSCINQCLTMDFKDYFALNLKGLIYDELHDFGGALNCFDRIIINTKTTTDNKLKNLRIWALNNKALTYANDKEYDKALDIIEKDLKDVAQKSFILDTQAFIHIMQEDYEKAAELLEQASPKGSKDKFVFYHKGNVYSKLGKSSRALRNYDVAIKIDKNFAEAYNDKAAELSKLARYDEAKEALQTAIRIKPGLVRAHENLIKISLGEQSFPTFWEFWKSSKIKKIAGTSVFILLSFLIIASVALTTNTIPNLTKVLFGNLTSTDNNTDESKSESGSVYPFLIGAGMLTLILLAPVIRTAKMGPLEFSFQDNQRSPQPLSFDRT